MKCEMPKCRRELDLDDTYEIDPGGKYRKVCRKCYEKLAAIQGEAGQSTEEETSEALQMALAL